MGSHVETKTSKHQQYRFPLSPPSSGSVTALSSPRLATLYPEDPDIVERLLTSAAVIHPPHLRASSTSELHATDSEGYATERSTPRHTPRRDVARKVNNRSLTLPSSSLSGTTNSPSKTARPLSRRSNSSCSSSSSSSPATHDHVPSASGIGRKVAATLQLFKETTGPSEDSQSVDVPSRSEPPSASSRRVASSSNISNVAEAQFEFVKRSEWPDRETAAIRREKSTTTLERVRAREPLAARDADDWPAKDRKSSIRDAATDLAQWRNDVISKQDTGRGRRRERIDDELVFDGFPVSNNNTLRELPSPFTRPNSRAYPPSPSPSRSPASRVSPVYTRPIESHSRSSTHSRASLPDLSIPSDPHPVSQSSTPTQTQPQFLFPQSAPLSPQGSTSFSPWSTDDDESTWETASNSTTTSTTSAHSYSYSPPRHGLSSYLRTPNDEEPDDDPFIYMKEDQKETEPRASSLERAKLDEFADAPLDDLHGQLPHIPLRPFRNQVGGHSAIYKFTRRAVCKPLVSRENLFYESVEREAPPLLGFIPRYLGVMLVSYRRMPKGSNISAPSPLSTDPTGELPQPSRPSLHKAITSPPLSMHNHSHPRDPTIEERDDADIDEAEMPEVVLDRNRHIIPEWMLRGGRNRSLSYSNINGTSISAKRQLKRTHWNGGTASSPDLATTPALSNMPRSTTSPLARYPPFATNEIEAPTPVNSPSQSHRSFPATLAGKLPHPTRPKAASDEDDLSGRPTFHSLNSVNSSSPRHSPWFGGTGSTVVNTKLKDHVFSTVLRRFKRRTGGRWEGTARTEDEGDAADVEGEGVIYGKVRNRVRRNRKLVSRVDRLRGTESDSCDMTLRRVQSESTIASPGKLAALATEREHDKNMMDVFDMDFDHPPDQENKDRPPAWHPNNPSRTIGRRRSRSRSLDSGPVSTALVYQPSTTHEASIPEQNEVDPSVTRQNHFILMEDLTGRLKHPCVMDLKMGTRQYGMDATSAKKKSQRKKCDRTTSRSLGVRVCGMQVWNRVTQSYVTQDKYMGREVHPQDFDSVLASFLFDGERLLAYQIPVLLQKLYALARIINRLKGYRFYGCSLLLIYDGDGETQEAFRSSFLENPSSRGKRGESLERQMSHAKQETKTEKQNLRRSHSEDLLVGPIAKRSSGRRKRGEVNVRIVDFAHTTTGRDWLPYPSNDRSLPNETASNHQGYYSEVDPETGLIYARFPPHFPDQPDRGFLLGLKNLANTLEQIWNQERIHRIKASRDNPSIAAYQLPPLVTDGKEIFNEIFGAEEDSGMIST